MISNQFLPVKKLLIITVITGFIFFLCFGTAGTRPALAQEIPTQEPGNFSTVTTQTLPGGNAIQGLIIHGPPVPPPGSEMQRQAVTLSDVHSAGANSLTVPAYSWVYGCSSVSGAMIAAYYDRAGFSNIYTGPTNGGVMPLVEDASWGYWTDSNYDTYPNNPLIASHAGLDGRSVSLKGSIDDYWISYDNSSDDPFISGVWEAHTNDAIGDYMWTSQSSIGLTDGGTYFYYLTNSSRLTCDSMKASGDYDGTLGRKLFYESKGYTVTECYNQNTDNNYSGGFSYNQYKAEIDAGRPVMINLNGHTIVGVGYEDPNTVYLHDTWDNNNHSMTWGGSYAGMVMQSVSIVNLDGTQAVTPGAFTKSSPANTTKSLVPALQTLSWGISANADHYEYCISSSKKGCTAAGTWITNAGTSVSLPAGTLLSNKTYYWQVRSVNEGAYSYADTGSLWSFKTLPLPGKPSAAAPANNLQTQDQTPDFSWGSVPNAETYTLTVALDKGYTSIVDTYNGSTASYTSSADLAEGVYYWHVKAINSNGESGQWNPTRSFTVDRTAPSAPVPGKPLNAAVSKTTPSFTWIKPAGSFNYQFEYDDANDFSSPVTSGLLKSASYKPAAMACGIYYWHIKALDAAGNDSGWSSAQTVQICPTP